MMHCCARCNTFDARLRCSACKLPYYCNSLCQSSHWKSIHKTHCKFLRESNNSNYTFDTFIETVTKTCLVINETLSQIETNKEEKELIKKHNQMIQGLFYYAKKIQRSTILNSNEKLSQLTKISTLISKYDISRKFEEITSMLCTNNDDSLLIETSLKSYRPSPQSIRQTVSDIYSKKLKLNDAMNVMYYKMYNNITSNTLKCIVDGINTALNELNLEFEEASIDKITQYFVEKIFKQNTVKRPDGCSELVRFDASYKLKQESGLLMHGYIRRMDSACVAPLEIISLCKKYCDGIIKDGSVNAAKLNVTTKYGDDDHDCMIGFHYGSTWNMDCAGDLFAFCGCVGYKGRQGEIDEFYINPNKDYKMESVRSWRGLSSPSNMIYCDNIHDTFWVAGDHRIKGSGYIENGIDTTYQDYELSCDYILSHSSIKGSKTLFVSDEKVFVYTDNGTFYIWDYNTLYEHYTDYCCECYDDEEIPEMDEHGIKTEAYSILDAACSEGDASYEVSGGQKHMDSFQIDTKCINNIKFHQSELAICDDMNEFDGYLFISNKHGIYRYNLEKNSICGVLLGHNAGCAQLSFRNGLLKQNLLISHDYGLVKVWDLRMNEATISIKTNDSSNAYELMTAVGFGFDGSGNKYIASGGRDEAITLWDLRNTNALYEISAGNNMIKQILWHKPSASLIAASDTGLYTSYWGNGRSDYEDVKWPTDAVHQVTDFPKEFDVNYNDIFKINFTDE